MRLKRTMSTSPFQLAACMGAKGTSVTCRAAGNEVGSTTAVTARMSGQLKLKGLTKAAADDGTALAAGAGLAADTTGGSGGWWRPGGRGQPTLECSRGMPRLMSSSLLARIMMRCSRVSRRSRPSSRRAWKGACRARKGGTLQWGILWGKVCRLEDREAPSRDGAERHAHAHTEAEALSTSTHLHGAPPVLLHISVQRLPQEGHQRLQAAEAGARGVGGGRACANTTSKRRGAVSGRQEGI